MMRGWCEGDANLFFYFIFRLDQVLLIVLFVGIFREQIVAGFL